MPSIVDINTIFLLPPSSLQRSSRRIKSRELMRARRLLPPCLKVHDPEPMSSLLPKRKRLLATSLFSSASQIHHLGDYALSSAFFQNCMIWTHGFSTTFQNENRSTKCPVLCSRRLTKIVKCCLSSFSKSSRSRSTCLSPLDQN
jgi:hypothetical protein